LQHAISVLQDIIVPEAKDGQALSFKERRSTVVLHRPFGVLSAIDFDDKASFAADEVTDEWSDPSLASELEPAQLPIAQTSP
jgi:hypothetical protein